MANIVEEFSRSLNKSAASEETFIRWGDYRKDITGFITDCMWVNGSSIVLGAGNLLDIDLRKISENSSEIVLADIDVDAVNRGLNKYGLCKNVSVLKSDLGGSELGELMRKVSDFIKDVNINGLKNCLDSFVFTSNFETVNYDNVIVSAIYTQLFIPQFLVLCEQFDLEINKKTPMIEIALLFAARFISHVNDEIMMLAADDATVCVWTDVLEYIEGSDAIEDIKNHINNYDWMEEFYQSYIRDYGHGLGSYGILNISERIETVNEKWFIWPFNETRTFVVKAVSGRVTS